jgi:hypothetical protein
LSGPYKLRPTPPIALSGIGPPHNRSKIRLASSAHRSDECDGRKHKRLMERPNMSITTDAEKPAPGNAHLGESKSKPKRRPSARRRLSPRRRRPWKPRRPNPPRPYQQESRSHRKSATLAKIVETTGRQKQTRRSAAFESITDVIGRQLSDLAIELWCYSMLSKHPPRCSLRFAQSLSCVESKVKLATAGRSMACCAQGGTTTEDVTPLMTSPRRVRRMSLRKDFLAAKAASDMATFHSKRAKGC